jgi:hypothetical protein
VSRLSTAFILGSSRLLSGQCTILYYSMLYMIRYKKQKISPSPLYFPSFHCHNHYSVVQARQHTALSIRYLPRPHYLYKSLCTICFTDPPSYVFPSITPTPSPFCPTPPHSTPQSTSTDSTTPAPASAHTPHSPSSYPQSASQYSPPSASSPH